MKKCSISDIKKIIKLEPMSCTDAYGKCIEESAKAYYKLRRECKDTDLVYLNGLKRLSSDCHPNYGIFGKCIPPKEIEHWVVRVGKYAVDITGIQFGKEFADQIGLWKEYKTRWIEITENAENVLAEIHEGDLDKIQSFDPEDLFG